MTLDLAPAYEAQAREFLAAAKKHCIISNSLKAPVDVTLTVQSAAVAASAA